MNIICEWICTLCGCGFSPQSPDNPASIAVPDNHALASLQLLQMELSVSVQSNEEVELQASLKDMALCDEQVSQREKKTGYVSLSLSLSLPPSPHASLPALLQHPSHSALHQ